MASKQVEDVYNAMSPEERKKWLSDKMLRGKSREAKLREQDLAFASVPRHLVQAYIDARDAGNVIAQQTAIMSIVIAAVDDIS